jgi:hypothetical protein
MASVQGDFDGGRSQTANDGSDNGFVMDSTEFPPIHGSASSNLAQQPQTQQSGSNLDSVVPAEGVQSPLATASVSSSQFEDFDDDDDSIARSDSGHSPRPFTRGTSHISEGQWESAIGDRANANGDTDGPDAMCVVAKTPVHQMGEAELEAIANDPAPTTTGNTEVDNEGFQTQRGKKVKCPDCKGRHVLPCSAEIVAANNLRKAEKAQQEAAATSSKKRPSEDGETHKPRKSKYPKLDRRAEGLPRNWCASCEDEHPWPDDDGTTYHTRSEAAGMLARNEARRLLREGAQQGQASSAPLPTAAQQPTPTAAQQPPTVQQPPQEQPESVLRAMATHEHGFKVYTAALNAIGSDEGKLNLLLQMYDTTRAASRHQVASAPTAPATPAPAPTAAPAAAPTNHYANAASGLVPGSYEFPSQNPWPSQRGRGRGGRGGRGRGSGRGSSTRGGRGGSNHAGRGAPTGQPTTPNAAPNAAPAAPNAAPAAPTAPAAPNAAPAAPTAPAAPNAAPAASNAAPAAPTAPAAPAVPAAPAAPAAHNAAQAAPNAAQNGSSSQTQSADQATRHGQGQRSNHLSSGPAGLRLRGRGRGRGDGST